MAGDFGFVILPNENQNAKNVLKWIKENIDDEVYISIMAQYFPTPAVKNHPELGRTLTHEEYEQVKSELESIGFYKGWVQELESNDYYIPDFELDKPFG